MVELSFLLKESSNPKANIDKLLGMHSLKSRSRHKENENQAANTKLATDQQTTQKTVKSDTTVTPSRPALQSVSRHLDQNASNLSRSFPKVQDGQKSFLSSTSKDKNSCSKSDSVLEEKSKWTSEDKSERTTYVPSPITVSPDRGSQKSSRRSSATEELTSPNVSLHCPSTDGLFERLDEFRFAENFTEAKKNLTKQLQDYSKQNFPQSHSLHLGKDFGHDREKTPPPDGEDRLSSLQAKHKMLRAKSLQKAQALNTQNYSTHSQGKVFNETGMKNHNNMEPEMPKLSSNSMDHGYMPGHHFQTEQSTASARTTPMSTIRECPVRTWLGWRTLVWQNLEASTC